MRRYDWSTQQLAEFLAVVSSARTEASAAMAAVERAAEALEAEVAAIVRGEDVVALVGYPEDSAPAAELDAVRPGVEGCDLRVPGLGACPATAVSLEHPAGARLVIARSGPERLTLEEAALLRGMARVTSMTMRMLRLLDAERNAREELERLAGEQAALRRVATLVARGVPPAEVFSAVADEVARLLDAQSTTIGRLEPDGTMVIVAGSGTAREVLPVGHRLVLESHMALAQVARTGRSARVDDYSRASEALSQIVHGLRVRCTVAVPIVVEGRLWGSIAAGIGRAAFPPEAERRMAQFTELAGTAIANAQSRSELTASRKRIVAASDETRRQIERDLHDGAQQRLIHIALNLKLAREAIATESPTVRGLLAEAIDHAEQATIDLRELVHGILPPVLTHGGLRPAVRTLARRIAVPVQTDVEVGRFPPAVEATAYFVVAEALTNVAKHSGASLATVEAHVDDGTLRIEVRDDGVGGARPGGSGLVGLADRVASLDGRLWVVSPADGGTLVAAAIPVTGELAAGPAAGRQGTHRAPERPARAPRAAPEAVRAWTDR